MTPEAQLEALGIVLPPPPPPAAHYCTFAQVGELAMTSGQLPWVDGVMQFPGKLPNEVSPEQGYQAARIAGVNAIAQLKHHLEDLARVEQIVRLEVLLHCVDDFFDQPSVADGASDLMHAVFGDRGRHTRSLAGTNAMPLNAVVQVNLFAHVQPA